MDRILPCVPGTCYGARRFARAVACAVNSDLKEEWKKYLDQTRTHVSVLEDICKSLNLDAKRETPGRKVVRTVGKALVDGIKFEHSNTSATQRQGAVFLTGSRNVVRNAVIQNMDSFCVMIDGDDSALLTSTITNCGQAVAMLNLDGMNLKNLTLETISQLSMVITRYSIHLLCSRLPIP